MIPEIIIPEIQANDRWQAIEELVNALGDQSRIDAVSRLGMARAVRLREASSSTGIGRGAALPHASGPFVERVVAAFGRSTAGIDFHASDRQPVHFVLLFVTPAGQFQAHLNLLARYSALFQNEAATQALKNAKDASGIDGVLRRYLA